MYADPYGLFSITNPATWPTPSQRTVDFVAGMGNGKSFGLAGLANRALGQNVNFCSGAYTGGNLAGMFVGSAAAIGKAAASGAFRHASNGKPWSQLSQSWKNVSPRVRRAQGIPRGNQLHHWAISRNGKFGRHVPNYIKNHPLNLKSLPTPIHQGVHGYGPTPFNAIGCWWNGTLGWAKVAQGLLSGGAASQAGNSASGGCGCP